MNVEMIISFCVLFVRMQILAVYLHWHLMLQDYMVDSF